MIVYAIDYGSYIDIVKEVIQSSKNNLLVKCFRFRAINEVPVIAIETQELFSNILIELKGNSTEDKENFKRQLEDALDHMTFEKEYEETEDFSTQSTNLLKYSWYLFNKPFDRLTDEESMIVFNLCSYILDIEDIDVERLQIEERYGSKGERAVAYYLQSMGYYTRSQVTFSDCYDNRCLPFDIGFYLDNRLCLIEFDGIQHFKPVSKFGGEEYFKYIKKHDRIKDAYCKKNNIPLLRIRYDERPQLEQIIDDFIAQVQSNRQEYFERYNEEVKNTAAAFQIMFQSRLKLRVSNPQLV